MFDIKDNDIYLLRDTEVFKYLYPKEILLTNEQVAEIAEDLNIDYTQEIKLMNTYIHTVECMRYAKLHREGVYNVANEDFQFRSLEGILDTLAHHKLEAMAYAVNRMVTKVFNGLLRLLSKIVTGTVKFSAKAKTTAAIWKVITTSYTPYLKDATLSRVSLHTFPASDYKEVRAAVAQVFAYGSKLDAIIFNSHDAFMTSEMEDIERALGNIDIKISLRSERVDMTELKDRRRHTDLVSLGYTKDYFPNMANHLLSQAKAAEDFKYAMRFDAVAGRIAHTFTLINKDVQDKRLAKGSEEYNDRLERAMTFSLRLSYMSRAVFAAITVGEYLADQTHDIFQRTLAAMGEIKEKEDRY